MLTCCDGSGYILVRRDDALVIDQDKDAVVRRKCHGCPACRGAKLARVEKESET